MEFQDTLSSHMFIQVLSGRKMVTFGLFKTHKHNTYKDIMKMWFH